MDRDKYREISFTNYGHRQNRLDLGRKNQFNLLPIQSGWDNEKCNKHLKPSSLYPSLLLGLTFLPMFQLRGMGESWSLHPTLSQLLLPTQRENSSHSFSAPVIPPQHESFLMGYSSSWTVPPGVPFAGFSSSGTDCSSAGLLQSGPSGTATYSSMRFSIGCRGASAPPLTSMCCRETACLTTGCRGISVPAYLPILFLTDLDIHVVVSLPSHSSLCTRFFSIFFFPS